MTGPRLVVRRTIRASAARLFAAWTDPAQLLHWWGPPEITCVAADVDLRVGGAWRIVNRRADGRTIVIAGEFIEISPPERLVYTWRVDDGPLERVTLGFDARGAETEIVIVHEHIADEPTRRGHEAGWIGCLDGLAAHFARD